MTSAEETPSAISPAELQEIVKVFADSDLRELRLSVGAVDLLISRNEHVDLAAPAPAPRVSRSPEPTPASPEPSAPASPSASAAEPADAGSSQAPEREGLLEVRSPALGTFYRRPAPDQPAFVEIGTAVAAGDAVGTIEVMKMFTTVTAEVSGTVAEICVGDAALVEHGQVLFYLEPAKS